MILKVSEGKSLLGRAAAVQAAEAIQSGIAHRDCARVVTATGASQFEFVEMLTTTLDVNWKKVELFQLDEYIGVPESHPASFCKFLRQRLIGKTGISDYHLLIGNADPAEVIRLAGEAIALSPIDVAFVGIGENELHLAFNDRPADFQTEEPYIIVHFGEASRQHRAQDLTHCLKEKSSVCRVVNGGGDRPISKFNSGLRNCPQTIIYSTKSL